MGRRKQDPKLKLFGKWHQKVGVVSAVLVILLAVTGILLNHSEHIGLARNHVSSDMLLSWYGIRPPQAMQSYPVKNGWVTQVQDRLYFGVLNLKGRHGSLVGAVTLNGETAVILADGIIILDAAGNLVEELPLPQRVRGELTRTGTWQGRLVLADDRQAYVADPTLSKWSAIGNEQIEWSAIGATPPWLEKAIGREFVGSVVSYERFMLDIHSGRILGWWGVILMDAAAIALLLLAASGSWLWLQRRRQEAAGARERAGERKG